MSEYPDCEYCVGYVRWGNVGYKVPWWQDPCQTCGLRRTQHTRGHPHLPYNSSRLVGEGLQCRGFVGTLDESFED